MGGQGANCWDVVDAIAGVVSAIFAILAFIWPFVRGEAFRERFRRSVWHITYWLGALVLVAAAVLKVLDDNSTIEDVGSGWILGLAVGGIVMGIASTALMARQRFRDDDAEPLPSPMVSPSYDAEDLLREDPVLPHDGAETPRWLRAGKPLPPPSDPADSG